VSLSNRVKKIEQSIPAKQRIMVVKYGAPLRELKYCDDLYLKKDDESEKEFVSRVLAIVTKHPKPNGSYLVGNMY
jgi:hypothetical protein